MRGRDYSMMSNSKAFLKSDNNHIAYLAWQVLYHYPNIKKLEIAEESHGGTMKHVDLAKMRMLNPQGLETIKLTIITDKNKEALVPLI